MADADSHRCGVRLAHERAERPVLVQSDWCFARFRSQLAGYGARAGDNFGPDLLLWNAAGVEIYYAPFDWANADARVVLVGITPGAQQMRRALRVAGELAGGTLSDTEVLAACKANASFSGSMRDFLVSMLDEIGIAAGLGLASAASLWEPDQPLASFTSTICYPTFVSGQNYRGESPRIDRVPILREFAERILPADLALTPHGLIVPLGKLPNECVKRLMDTGQVDPARCLLGMPHPSSMNGHRTRQFSERREDLRRQVNRYFGA